MSENNELAQKGAEFVAGTAADVITAIPSVQDKALLKAALDAELVGKNRTTVVQTLNDAIGEDPNVERGDSGSDAKPAEKVAYVKMTRDEPQFEGGPVEAQVHPDEVGNYAVGGWQKA